MDDKIVIGKIVSLVKHPNADKLNLCQITIGLDSLLNVVCGANNININDIVPVSLPGAFVLDEFGQPDLIYKTILRGIESEAMLCSARELGLGPDHDGIYLLSPDLEKHTGQPVNKYIVK